MEENFNVGNPTKENIDYAFKNLIFYFYNCYFYAFSPIFSKINK